MKTIAIVIPCHNESENISKIHKKISDIFKNLNYEYCILFVEDGSTDATFSKIQKISKQNIHYLKFSRNFGHQMALKAGLDFSTDFDACILMDCDLQHPPEVLPELLKAWEEGFKIVNTIRISNKDYSFWKRIFTNLFYYFLNKFSDVKITPNASDFRLMDKEVVKIIAQNRQCNLFLRGFIQQLGFLKTEIPIKIEKRTHGKSSYNFMKMLNLAFDGMMSLGVKPLYSVVFLGFIILAIAILYLPYVVFAKIQGWAVSGWATIIMEMTFLAGIQIIILGIIGIYIGKMFLQIQNNPPYIIEKKSFKK